MTVLEARTRPETCLSDLILDRLVAGEISGGSERALAESHLASCALCRRRHAEIEAAPALAPDRAWLRDLQAAETRRRRPALAAAGALAITVLATLLLVLRPKPLAEPDAATTRTKGTQMALEIFSRRGDRPAEPVFADLPLRPGDAIRFRISAPRDGYFTVLGLDAAQRVTRYVPAEGAPPAHLRQQTGDHDGSRAVDIEGSVILDEMLGDEKVIALLCPTADEAERSLDVARTTLATAGSPGAVTRLATPCLQASASFRKEAAR